MTAATPNLSRVLAAYLSGPISLPDLARSLALDLSELLRTLASPAFTTLLEAAQLIAAHRAKVTQSMHALGALSSLCGETHSDTTRLRAATTILRHLASEQRAARTPPQEPDPAPRPSFPATPPTPTQPPRPVPGLDIPADPLSHALFTPPRRVPSRAPPTPASVLAAAGAPPPPRPPRPDLHPAPAAPA